MPRVTDAGRKNALAAKVLVPANLVRVSLGCTDSTYTDQAACELNSETWTDDILIATFPSNLKADVGEGELTFQAAKDLLDISDIEESLSMDLGTVSLELSGITGVWLQLSQEIEIINRPVEIWKVLLDPDTYEIINAPFKIFGGVIVSGDINKSKVGIGSVIRIEVSNEYYNFEIYRGFRCTVNDHQNFFPDDTGFKFCSSIKKKVQWGLE